MPNGDDHDLLIRIDTKMDIMRKTLEDHVQEDSTQFSFARQSREKLHERLDAHGSKVNWVLVCSVLAIIFMGLSIFYASSAK